MILFMIRHGQTQANVEDLLYGQLEYPLTEAGCAQAAALQPLLANYQFDRVYSSDLGRAVQTAKLAIPGCEPIQTPLLREYDIGTIAPIKRADFYAHYRHLLGNYSSVGGEDNKDVKHRLGEFLHQLEADPQPYVAAFSHNGTIRCLMRMIIGEGINSTALQSNNCNVAVFRYENENWKLAAWNLAGDL